LVQVTAVSRLSRWLAPSAEKYWRHWLLLVKVTETVFIGNQGLDLVATEYFSGMTGLRQRKEQSEPGKTSCDLFHFDLPKWKCHKNLRGCCRAKPRFAAETRLLHPKRPGRSKFIRFFVNHFKPKSP